MQDKFETLANLNKASVQIKFKKTQWIGALQPLTTW